MSTVFPNWAAIDAHLQMPHRHDRLIMRAAVEGGACTKRFRQGSDNRQKGIGSLYHLRHRGGSRWGGVCKALTLYWMAYHANDWDFWSWLFADNGHLHTWNAAAVCDLQGAYTDDPRYNGGVRGRRAAGLTKFQFMRDVLRRSGLVERKDPFGVSMSINNQWARGDGGRVIGQAIAPDYVAGKAMYKQISIHGSAGGHAVCAWVAEDVMFFDPNYGEYWFETPAQFRRWFNFFWHESGYYRAFSMDYTIHCFGKSINHFSAHKTFG